MRLMADFIIDSDMCLPTDAEPLVVNGPDGQILYLQNIETSPETIRTLAARLAYDCDDWEKAKKTADDGIVHYLNSLSFSTGRVFSVKELRLIIDWTPGLQMRDARGYAERPYWQRAEPSFEPEYASSTEYFLTVFTDRPTQTAARWYRRGISADGAEEQFRYLWFVVEIAAEYTKDRVKVPSACPHCQGPLYCQVCEIEPLHAKYPGQAIKSLFDHIVGRDADQIFRVLQKIRHTLMHGDPIDCIIGELPCDTSQAVNMLGNIARHAILSMLEKARPNDEPPELVLGLMDDITRRKLVGTAVIQLGLLPGADIDNPLPKDIPSFEFEIFQPAYDEGAQPPP
jgi:hypothetical protein